MTIHFLEDVYVSVGHFLRLMSEDKFAYGEIPETLTSKPGRIRVAEAMRRLMPVLSLQASINGAQISGEIDDRSAFKEEVILIVSPNFLSSKALRTKITFSFKDSLGAKDFRLNSGDAKKENLSVSSGQLMPLMREDHRL